MYFSEDEQNFKVLVKIAPKNVIVYVNVQVPTKSRGLVAGDGLAVNGAGVGVGASASLSVICLEWTG